MRLLALEELVVLDDLSAIEAVALVAQVVLATRHHLTDCEDHFDGSDGKLSLSVVKVLGLAQVEEFSTRHNATSSQSNLRVNAVEGGFKCLQIAGKKQVRNEPICLEKGVYTNKRDQL